MISLQDVYQQVHEEQEELVRQYGQPKVGRWVYCKYCYSKVRPEIDWVEDLVICTQCGAGLAPLQEVIKFGSYQKWYAKIELDFVRFQAYWHAVRNGAEATGEDEYGVVPYICPVCKRNEITVYSSRGKFCKDCDKEER